MREILFNEALIKSASCYGKLAKLQQEIANSDENYIRLKLDIEKSTGLTFAFCLSFLPLLAESKGKELVIIANSKIIKNMCKIGVIDWKDSIILKDVDISRYLMEKARMIKSSEDIFKLVPEITKEAPVIMDDRLAALFTSKTGEMFNNSLEHSEAKYIVGGKYYKYRKNLYCFSCYDTGVGIPQKVKKYLLDNFDLDVTQKEAFKWAMGKGNSTANLIANFQRIPRGLGMELLKSFVQLNNGAIRICSGDVLYVFNGKGERFYKLNSEFMGTLFEMDIVADNEHKYILK